MEEIRIGNTNCCVKNCKNVYNNTTSETKFYSFPKADYKHEQCAQWISWVKKVNPIGWEPSKYSRVCSDHFVDKKTSTIASSPSYVPSILYHQNCHSQVEEKPLIKRVNDKRKIHQQKYREQNREKLKQREAERRKRKKNVQSITEPFTSLNVNRIELNNEKPTDANSQSLTGLEGPQTSSVQENKMIRQQRYREQNREKLKQREAERRQRQQSPEIISEATIDYEISTDSLSVADLEETQYLFADTTEGVAKSSAQRQRECRLRKRLGKAQFPKKIPKTAVERQRKYRENKKKKLQSERSGSPLEMEIDNRTTDHIEKPRQIIGIGLYKTLKTSAERGREFRARKALLKQQVKQQQPQDTIDELPTEYIQSSSPLEENKSAGPSQVHIIERRVRSAEATRRWREKKRGVSGMPKKQAKTVAQRMREYRQRKKFEKMLLTQQRGQQNLDAMDSASIEDNERADPSTINSVSAELNKRGSEVIESVLPQRKNKTAAERMRDYRARRNDIKIKSKTKESQAEYMREYRKKMKLKEPLLNPVLAEENSDVVNNIETEEIRKLNQEQILMDPCDFKTEIDIDDGILEKIKEEEEDWETTDVGNDADPLRIDENIADKAIIKFEKEPLINIDVHPKEEPPWPNSADIKTAIVTEEGIFVATNTKRGEYILKTKPDLFNSL